MRCLLRILCLLFNRKIEVWNVDVLNWIFLICGFVIFMFVRVLYIFCVYVVLKLNWY